MTAKNNTGSTSQSYLENIDDVYYKIVNVSPGQPGFDTWYAGPYKDAVDATLNYYLLERRTMIPDWQTFVSKAAEYAGLGSNTKPIEDEFVKGFRFSTFSDSDRNAIDLSTPPSEDFQLLTDAGLTGAVKIRAQFINAFNDLVTNFPIGDEKSLPGVTPEEFKNTFENFFARSALIEDSSLVNLPKELTEYYNVDLVGSYEEVFNTFYPYQDLTVDEKRALFEHILTTFAKEKINTDGYFVPTQSFEDWTAFIEQSAALRIFGKSTSLESMGAEQVLILDRIFLLLITMVDVLQEIAAFQSDRLAFLTSWQKAYTSKISEIHVFTSNDGTFLGTGNIEDSNFSNARAEANQLGTSYKENLSAYRQIVSDDSKSMQSSINQSTDAVTQQSNMASSILEQLSTLLASIFR